MCIFAKIITKNKKKKDETAFVWIRHARNHSHRTDCAVAVWRQEDS